MTRTLDIEQLETFEPRLKALVEHEGQIVLTHDSEPIAMLLPVQTDHRQQDDRPAQSPGL